MNAALIQFFTRRHEDEEATLSKNLDIKKKHNDSLFLRFYKYDPSEEEPRGKSQMFSVPSFLIQSCWDPQITFCS